MIAPPVHQAEPPSALHHRRCPPTQHARHRSPGSAASQPGSLPAVVQHVDAGSHFPNDQTRVTAAVQRYESLPNRSTPDDSGDVRCGPTRHVRCSDPAGHVAALRLAADETCMQGAQAWSGAVMQPTCSWLGGGPQQVSRRVQLPPLHGRAAAERANAVRGPSWCRRGGRHPVRQRPQLDARVCAATGNQAPCG